MEHRRVLKQNLLVASPVCVKCGELFTRTDAVHMHEGIVTRGDARGWGETERKLIFNKVNCFLLHAECHEIPPSREECRRYAEERYGRGAVMSWLDSLPWKSRWRRVWQNSEG